MSRGASHAALHFGGELPGLDAELPSGRGFIALLAALRDTGGTAPGEVVARLLEEHHVGLAVSLARLVHSGQAFGFEWRASLWIPMFQFDIDSLTLKAGVQQVRAQLPSLWSGWTVASWFATPDASLHGRCPAGVVDDGLDAVLHAALHAAQSLDIVDERLLPLVRRAREVAAHV